MEMFAVLLLLAFSCLAALLNCAYVKYGRLYALGSRFPGPPALPLIGNALIFLGIESDEFVRRCAGLARDYGNRIRFWLGPQLNILLHDWRDVEVLLNSNKLTVKSDQYRVLSCWMHDGILLSRGRKYQQRRKLVLPTFHFKMLEEFLPCFQEHTAILMAQIRAKCANGKPFEFLPLLGLCMLDTICDTAMGVQIHSQRNADCEYVKALRSLTEILHLRMFDIKYYFRFIFRWTSKAAEAKRALRIMEDFAEKVILQRRKELMHAPLAQQSLPEEDQLIGMKRKRNFLDILLNSSIDGKPLSNTDIREEVNVFMFAGHDTLSSALMFFFYCIFTNKDCERKCYEEICSAFGSDGNVIEMKRERLNQLHYVELCIKETLRMYPPAPLIGRKAVEEVTINENIIPAGANIGFSPYIFGRKSEVYAEPNTFKPSRFDMRTRANSTEPQPCILTSFSAGPRSCVGQKYAMLQLKVVIVNVLLNFQMEYVGDVMQEPMLSSEVTLGTKEPLMFIARARGTEIVR